MVNRSVAATILIFLMIALVAGSCKKNCSSTVCKTYGYNTTLGRITSEVCLNGNCQCPDGYEGDSCQKFSINKYFFPTTNWRVYDACSGSTNYSVYMVSSTNSYAVNEFYIYGIFNGGTQLKVTIASSGHQGVYLNVPAQQTSVGYVNGGVGQYQSNGTYGRINMTLDFTPNSTSIETSCTLILNQY